MSADDALFRIVDLVLDEAEVQRRMSYFEIDSEDEKVLVRAHDLLESHVEEIVERFYEFLLAHEHTRRLLSEQGLIERLKEIQRRYFHELTSGRYDRDYFENRLRVGLTHRRIGLSPQWYLGAFRKYRDIITGLLRDLYGSESVDYRRAAVSFHKIITLDMSLAIDAYAFSAQEELAQRAEALETANRRLVEIDAAKRHLTGAIVHDLQNPLAGIIAFLQVLEARPGGLTEVETRSLQEALARCNDLSDLIMDVLQMNRAEEGRLDLYMENVELGEITRSAVEAFSLVAEQGGKRLRFDSSGDPVNVRTDQSLLRRILYNLVRNALQHTPAGTQVQVSVKLGPPWVVSVRDNGPGIPTEIQDRLFEPGALRSAGYQVHSGVGLGFCKMAADALDMTLHLTSEPGQGTCFCLKPGRIGDAAQA
jgi:signal transduction histidine kinase